MNENFFKINNPISVAELAKIIGLEPELNGGDENQIFEGIEKLNIANSSQVSFCGKSPYIQGNKYIDDIKNTKAGAVIIASDYVSYVPTGCIIFQSKTSTYNYAKLLEYFYIPKQEKSPVIERSAYVSNNAKLGNNVYVGHNAVIEDDVEIGDDSYIDSNVVIKNGCKIGNSTKIYSGSVIQYSSIGSNCIIHTNVCIGQDGYGNTFYNGSHYKVPQVGSVIIGNNVEIGSGTCIDRGSANETIIGDGSKLDNLVQIAHNVVIGKHCLIVSQVGIAGSTVIGDYTVLGGQVGVAGHLKIGSQVQVAAQSGIAKDIPSGTIMGGSPAVPIKEWHRQTIALQKLIKRNNKE